MRDENDLFDAFAMGVSIAVAGSLCCRHIGMFKELFELSDKCIPCLYWMMEWSGSKSPGRDQRSWARPSIRASRNWVRQDGHHFDLPRLGTRSGFSKELVAKTLEHGIALYVGGEITEKDFESLEQMGVAGALL